MATQVYSAAIQTKAQALLDISDLWARGYRRRDGVQFVVFSSQSTPGIIYYTRIDGAFCTCPAANRSRTGRCHHKLAAQMAAQRAREAACQPATKSYENLFPENSDAF